MKPPLACKRPVPKNTIGDATDFPIPAYHQFDIGPFFVIKKALASLIFRPVQV
jgi:hypothetical protein